MDLKTLKTFQLIVKYGSFNRAAEEMNYAQSTVTMQIQKLESDLGIKLIERGKKITLTEAGRMFHEQSIQIVKNMELLQTNMTDLQLGEAGNIRIGVTEPTASYRLPSILEKFITQFPKIRVSVEFANTPVLSERLLKGEIDFALCSEPDLGSELYFEPLFKEAFVLLMPENHPLTEKSDITLDDIRRVRLLITSATCPYRRKLEMVLQESGNIGSDTMEIGSMTALKYYVERGLGIAFVPEIVLNPVPSGTIVRTMSDCHIDMTFGILCKTSEYPLSSASSKLYEFIKQDLIEK
ncbi:LysR family transcriptional regulator [Paenibacillus macquariensis]|uniref:DNA-binding transcriptional regulator, LysR family n=1 Tax=Paenibacillus macquariensis TaxID=948756 RepID=A0ABY1JJE4_9BACL|nr:LysR family transcriptional regulator [Paenibacillus macquariensis]MEC0089710.1 LysR family transcriptional regulator [Paenibacillus macquariensis]OAB30811.1 transcriptional regulator [Paenibacillus macquariensis subsp. macquariensis]SIQ29336.1 DNA-binding transcriptional regulator, LysR family [Paenibacillus macquariensis]